MEAFSHIGDHKTPTIIFDPDKKLFLIRGRSFPDDAHTFYKPALDWLKKYAQTHKGELVFTVMFYYYNSSTAKLLLEMFNILQEIHDRGNEVTVRWLYHEDDEVMREQGEDYKELFTFRFEFVTFSDKTIK